jgi:hypothetical protein
MKRFLLAIPAAILLVGSAAIASPAGGGPSGPVIGGGSITSPGADYGQMQRKHRAIAAVLQEGKKIQIADGGTLTDAHLAELQRELDAARSGNY